MKPYIDCLYQFALCIILLVGLVGCSGPSEPNHLPPHIKRLQDQATHNCSVDQVASTNVQSIIWEPIIDKDQIVALRRNDNRHTYNLANIVPVKVEDEDLDVNVLMSNADTTTYESHTPYLKKIYDILYISYIDKNTMQVYLHKIDIEHFKEMYQVIKDQEILTSHPVTKREACYTLTVTKMENPVISVKSEGDGWLDPDLITELFQNRHVYQVLSYSNWKESEKSDHLAAITAMHLELTDASNKGRYPIKIAFQQPNIEFNNSVSSVTPFIDGLRTSYFLGNLNIPLIFNNLSREIFNQRVLKKNIKPFELHLTFSGGTDSDQMDFEVLIKAQTDNPLPFTRISVL